MWTELLCGIGISLIVSGIRIVRPTELGVVERLGKFRRVEAQGFHWIIPVVDRMIEINITERMADIKPREMITKDNLNIGVDMVVYYKVKPTTDNVKKSLYNVDNFPAQIIALSQSTARKVIGTMKFEEVNSNRQVLNRQLEEELEKQINDWGIEIARVEVQEIAPPSDVQETMNRIIKASNEKEAATDFATAKETEADGLRRAEIKKAEGIKQARILEAEGKAQAIKLENEAIQKYFKHNAIDYKKLETAERSLKENTKYIVGTDKDLSLVLSEASGITPIKKRSE